MRSKQRCICHTQATKKSDPKEYQINCIYPFAIAEDYFVWLTEEWAEFMPEETFMRFFYPLADLIGTLSDSSEFNGNLRVPSTKQINDFVLGDLVKVEINHHLPKVKSEILEVNLVLFDPDKDLWIGRICSNLNSDLYAVASGNYLQFEQKNILI